MAKKRYYAVKVGRTPGIYTQWADAQKEITGYPNAVFKGFATEAEARAFLGEEFDASDSAELRGIELPTGSYAFVDGSYNPETGVYGYGGFLVHDGQEHVLQGSGDDEMTSMHNVAGEISGAMAAVDKALELGVETLTICYDYNGIRNWALKEGAWKTNREGTRRYRERMLAAMTVMDIQFIHTPGHTGIPGNERADALAKEAVGL